MPQPRASEPSTPTTRLAELLGASRIEEMSDSETQAGGTDDGAAEAEVVAPPEPVINELFTTPPKIRVQVETKTSKEQAKTVDECLERLTDRSGRARNSHGLQRLRKAKHNEFLHDALGDYPGKFVLMDASRPWLLYWSLSGIALLGSTDITDFEDRLADTVTPCQNRDGGFGGGHGQISHLAASYAIVLALVIVGGDEGFNLIDRRAMWHWLGAMKQSDGGFTLCHGGEEDVRGAYCALVMLSILDLPLELPPEAPARQSGMTSLLDGLLEWISKCQTYEGGLAGAPGCEAHGAYTFCGLAALCILGEPHATINKSLDVPSLVAWLSSRQHAPEGGFAGRTNKLVDGCYSHWVGGCWALVEAAVHGPVSAPTAAPPPRLWSREGLATYILQCCQNAQGGLKDKPSKNPDAYHTNYNICGLSAAQHRYAYCPSQEPDMEGNLKAGFSWVMMAEGEREEEGRVFDDEDRVGAINPVYVVPVGRAERARRFFESKRGF
ncbi:terpenoid cyclases/protein prenyltransferase alpha-alpha toroid [Lineolata rhizophorae]|uniref:Protein farnesyltransferase subunit beta n=1 Tax=Lineolata rhizophorae TaxID=578093 RepID=A0A6A6PB65_9PEZI|nr:terpenoid cyclases/protein prenyltransferase alpha-alpha toroid [Lineolata rhizophorae]